MSLESEDIIPEGTTTFGLREYKTKMRILKKKLQKAIFGGLNHADSRNTDYVVAVIDAFKIVSHQNEHDLNDQLYNVWRNTIIQESVEVLSLLWRKCSKDISVWIDAFSRNSEIGITNFNLK